MARQILITGEEILYRDEVVGQPKPEWKKGPSINLTELPTTSSNTRMQVSGNQYMQLSALQSFFAQAFSDIEHDHDDRYDALGTAAGLVASEASTRSNADNAISQAVTDLTTLVNQISNWKTSLTDADTDSIVNTLTELFASVSSLPEGTDLYALINSKLSGSDVVNTLTSVLTNVPLSAAMGTQLKGMIDTLTTSFNNHTANHAPANAQANVIEKVKWNGVELTPDVNKTINITDEDIKEMLITYYSSNGILSPKRYLNGASTVTFTGYKLMTGVTDFSITIGSTTYTKANITNVVLAANTEMTINSLTLTAGYTDGNCSLLFK